jgi:hypothetical protein
MAGDGTSVAADGTAIPILGDSNIANGNPIAPTEPPSPSLEVPLKSPEAPSLPMELQ